MRIALLSMVVLLLMSCASDSVNDRRVGQQMVCHKGKKTITVSNAASFAHLDHGDTPGPCPQGG
jgi:ABC-type molybdate transport system substrate-binding protein